MGGVISHLLLIKCMESLINSITISENEMVHIKNSNYLSLSFFNINLGKSSTLKVHVTAHRNNKHLNKFFFISFFYFILVKE